MALQRAVIQGQSEWQSWIKIDGTGFISQQIQPVREEVPPEVLSPRRDGRA
jgi:hypothetical protein